eukprot:scaffold120702_cov36-Phaeocystis_antarctica.AAC.1
MSASSLALGRQSGRLCPPCAEVLIGRADRTGDALEPARTRRRQLRGQVGGARIALLLAEPLGLQRRERAAKAQPRARQR